MKKTFRRGFIPLIFILTLMSISFAASQQTYSKLGNDNEYQAGDGTWNSLLPTSQVSYYSTGIGKQKHTPLVADLNGDSTKDIVIMDNDNIKVFEFDGDSLDVQAAYDYGDEQETSNMLLYDIDSDNVTEIIFMTIESDTMNILDFNGTALINNSYSTAATWTELGGDSMINCDDSAGYCTISYARYDTSTRENIKIFAASFSSTTPGTPTLIELRTSPTGGHHAAFCKSMWGMPEYDFQTGYWFFGWNFVANAYSNGYENGGLYLYSMSYNGSVFSNVDNEFVVAAYDTIPGAGGYDACSGAEIQGNKHFTNIIVDPDFSSDAGSEVIVAYQTADDQFQIEGFQTDFSSIGLSSTYPSLFDADGIMISNLMFMKAFGTGNAVDVCVVGYDNADNQIELMCGSENTGFWSFDSKRFQADITDYNITFDTLDILDGIAHAVDYTAATNDELLTSYGVFELEDNILCTAVSSAFCDLEFIYTDDIALGTVIPIDYTDFGENDYLKLTSSALWYVDDGFSKSGPSISACTVNPSINGKWILNTSVSVSVTATEPDGDLLRVRSILYYGDDNEMDGEWSSYKSSGGSATDSYTANKSITNGVLRLEAHDTDNETNASVELSFDVASNGVLNFGDAIYNCNEGDLGEVEDEVVVGTPCTSTADCSGTQVCPTSGDDAFTCQTVPTGSTDRLKQEVDNIAIAFGISKIVIFLVILLLLNAAAIYKQHESPSALVFSLLLLNNAWILLSWALTLITVYVVISIYVVIVFATLLIIGGMIAKKGTGG